MASSTVESRRTLSSIAFPCGCLAYGKYTWIFVEADSPRPDIAAYISEKGFEELPEEASIAVRPDFIGLIGATFFRANIVFVAEAECEVGETMELLLFGLLSPLVLDAPLIPSGRLEGLSSSCLAFEFWRAF